MYALQNPLQRQMLQAMSQCILMEFKEVQQKTAELQRLDQLLAEMNSELDELVVTDTIPLRDDAKACKRIRVLSIAGLFAETIRRISTDDSVSSLFVE